MSTSAWFTPQMMPIVVLTFTKIYIYLNRSPISLPSWHPRLSLQKKEGRIQLLFCFFFCLHSVSFLVLVWFDIEKKKENTVLHLAHGFSLKLIFLGLSSSQFYLLYKLPHSLILFHWFISLIRCFSSSDVWLSYSLWQVRLLFSAK